MTLTRSYQEYTSQFKRMDVAETIIAEHRVNDRRLLDGAALILKYFANHCGPNLPDGWAVGESELAVRYGKSVVTISRMIKVLRTEELIDRKQAGRNPARYTLGRAFFEYIRVITSDKSNGESSYHPRQVEMTASDKSSVPDPYQQDKKQDTDTHSRVRASEGQESLLGKMLGERNLEWADVVANSDRIPGLSAELPAELDDLPSADFQAVFTWVKAKPAKPRVEKPEEGGCVMDHAKDCAHNGCDHEDHNDEECCDVSCSCSCCECYEERVTSFFSDGIRDQGHGFARASLYHKHGLSVVFLDRMLHLYTELGGSATVLVEIDKCLNRKAISQVRDIHMAISNWLGKAVQWQRGNDEEREATGKRRQSGRYSQVNEGKDGGWGDTEAARRSRERIRNLPDVRVESEAEPYQRTNTCKPESRLRVEPSESPEASRRTNARQAKRLGRLQRRKNQSRTKSRADQEATKW